ncbi:MAG: ATP-binding cassette domain-containing protein [Anaerolineae bacterium]|nr:ATP-binding cassette domain-containing protein [Anaerolineae bacterium]
MDTASTEPLPLAETEPPARLSGSINKLLKRAFWVYLRPYWPAQIGLMLTVVVTVLLHTSLPLTLKFLIDSAIVPRNEQMLILILGGIGGLFILYAVSDIVQAYVQAQVGAKIKRDLWLNLFTHLQHLPVSFFDHTQPGEITTLFAQDIITLRATLRDLTVEGLRAILLVVVTIGAMIFLNWRLSLMVALILPLMTIIPRWILKKSTAADYGERCHDAAVAHAVQDNVAAQPLLRAFGLHDLAISKFAALIGQEPDSPTSRLVQLKKGLRVPHFQRSMVVVWTDIQQMAILGVTIAAGAYLAWRGQLTIGAFSAFIVLLSQAGRAITALSIYVRNLIAGASALERIEQVLNAPLDSAVTGSAVTLPPISEQIRFDGVSFGYPGQSLQIKDVSFTIAARHSIAFVGRSGAGKSTLLKLLLRFYDPSEGQILIDGYDLCQVDQRSFRGQIGVVLQEAPLLNTTIRENICLVKPDATDEEVIAAARLAEIHETIVALPQGYHTPVGEGGKWLSPGQRQRVALARALLHQPSLLLLDEITAALDLEAEAAINQTLKKLARERTVVTVTHRLSSVVEADQIVVVDNGQVVEQGTHWDLLKNKQFYRRLWQLQSGFIISADGQYAEVRGARLRFIPLFAQLDDATLNAIADQFVSEYFDAEQIVFTQGSAGDKFYIIVRGKVAVSLTTEPDGARVTLAQLEDGDYFGEIALVEGGTRRAAVQTILPSLFLTLERERFEKLMTDLPSLQKIVQRKARERTMDTLTTIEHVKSPLPFDLQ